MIFNNIVTFELTSMVINIIYNFLRSIAPIFLTQKPQEVLVNATARSMVTLIRTDTTLGIPLGLPLCLVGKSRATPEMAGSRLCAL
jgi:hypothetical protein